MQPTSELHEKKQQKLTAHHSRRVHTEASSFNQPMNICAIGLAVATTISYQHYHPFRTANTPTELQSFTLLNTQT